MHTSGALENGQIGVFQSGSIVFLVRDGGFLIRWDRAGLGLTDQNEERGTFLTMAMLYRARKRAG